MSARHPVELHWADVDPARVRWTRDDRLRAAAAAAVRARDESVLNDAIVATCGPWAAGWRWCRDEGSLGGGVVSAWCCPLHSLVGGDDAIAARALDAVDEWRAWLVHLADVFEALRPRPGDDLEVQLARGCTLVLAEVADATGCGDAWYVHAEQVLCWFLEHGGASTSKARAAVAQATRGVFSSWCGVADEVAARVGAAIAGAARHDVRVDAPDDLARYRAFRPALPVAAARPRAPRESARDGHAAYIATHDAARDDGERAPRLLEALRLARQLAADGALLDLALLRRMHAVACGDGGDRRGPAFAKGGRERYGFGDTLAAACDEALVDANDVDVDVVDRAARAYLDVCFFHPFHDGNARAARLAFDFVLAREGVIVDDVTALFAFPIAATPEACAAYVRLVRSVVDSTP
ncbi:MAG: Fic family protein [Planctomycetes bacterium]|nr:Fic family protein [Planctomycetota bacterium]